MIIDELASNKTWVWLQQGNQHSSYQENDMISFEPFLVPYPLFFQFGKFVNARCFNKNPNNRC